MKFTTYSLIQALIKQGFSEDELRGKSKEQLLEMLNLTEELATSY